MNLKKTNVLVFTFLASINLFAQVEKQMKQGGEVIFNKEKVKCLKESDRIEIRKRLDEERLALKKAGNYINPSKAAALDFGWPVQKSVDAPYNETWAISYYMDHNMSFGIQDYICGVKTYNGHKGVDIYMWPFYWEQMSLNYTEIIAAEAGQIVYKQDQNSDQNCSDGGQWNAVYIQHSDGSTAWYGHMKKESLTTKNVGDMVSKGEFLGIIGSSGDSNGPHLHFEVYDSNGALIDPYYDSCNALNIESWWADQKDYLDSNINAVLTHSDYPDFNTCPEVETSNIQNSFSLTDTVVVGVYLREQLQGTSMDLEITRPDGSIKSSWTYNFVNDYTVSYYTWEDIPDMVGEWTWKATYLGQIISHKYTVATLSIEDVIFEGLQIFPNPAKNFIIIEAITEEYEVGLYDIRGRQIFSKTYDGVIDSKLDLSFLSNGAYILTIETVNGRKKNLKVIKN